MKDTPKEMAQKQLEIMLEKTAEERFIMGIEMSEFAADLTRKRLLREYPDSSEKVLKLASLRGMYQRELPSLLFTALEKQIKVRS